MSSVKKRELSEQGINLLNNPILSAVLSEVAFTAGFTPEEYLLRFEEVLSNTPEKIFAIFEN